MPDQVAPNPHLSEVITAAETVVGFVFGCKVEAGRRRENLEPLSISALVTAEASRVFGALDRALTNYRLAEQATKDVQGAVNFQKQLMEHFK